MKVQVLSCSCASHESMYNRDPRYEDRHSQSSSSYSSQQVHEPTPILSFKEFSHGSRSSGGIDQHRRHEHSNRHDRDPAARPASVHRDHRVSPGHHGSVSQRGGGEYHDGRANGKSSIVSQPPLVPQSSPSLGLIDWKSAFLRDKHLEEFVVVSTRVIPDFTQKESAKKTKPQLSIRPGDDEDIPTGQWSPVRAISRYSRPRPAELPPRKQSEDFGSASRSAPPPARPVPPPVIPQKATPQQEELGDFIHNLIGKKPTPSTPGHLGSPGNVKKASPVVKAAGVVKAKDPRINSNGAGILSKKNPPVDNKVTFINKKSTPVDSSKAAAHALVTETHEKHKASHISAVVGSGATPKEGVKTKKHEAKHTSSVDGAKGAEAHRETSTPAVPIGGKAVPKADVTPASETTLGKSSTKKKRQRDEVVAVVEGGKAKKHEQPKDAGAKGTEVQKGTSPAAVPESDKPVANVDVTPVLESTLDTSTSKKKKRQHDEGVAEAAPISGSKLPGKKGKKSKQDHNVPAASDASLETEPALRRSSRAKPSEALKSGDFYCETNGENILKLLEVQQGHEKEPEEEAEFDDTITEQVVVDVPALSSEVLASAVVSEQQGEHANVNVEVEKDVQALEPKSESAGKKSKAKTPTSSGKKKASDADSGSKISASTRGARRKSKAASLPSEQKSDVSQAPESTNDSADTSHVAETDDAQSTADKIDAIGGSGVQSVDLAQEGGVDGQHDKEQAETVVVETEAEPKVHVHEDVPDTLEAQESVAEESVLAPATGKKKGRPPEKGKASKKKTETILPSPPTSARLTRQSSSEIVTRGVKKSGGGQLVRQTSESSITRKSSSKKRGHEETGVQQDVVEPVQKRTAVSHVSSPAAVAEVSTVVIGQPSSEKEAVVEPIADGGGSMHAERGLEVAAQAGGSSLSQASAVEEKMGSNLALNQNTLLKAIEDSQRKQREWIAAENKKTRDWVAEENRAQLQRLKDAGVIANLAPYVCTPCPEPTEYVGNLTLSAVDLGSTSQCMSVSKQFEGRSMGSTSTSGVEAVQSEPASRAKSNADVDMVVAGEGACVGVHTSVESAAFSSSIDESQAASIGKKNVDVCMVECAGVPPHVDGAAPCTISSSSLDLGHAEVTSSIDVSVVPTTSAPVEMDVEMPLVAGQQELTQPAEVHADDICAGVTPSMEATPMEDITFTASLAMPEGPAPCVDTPQDVPSVMPSILPDINPSDALAWISSHAPADKPVSCFSTTSTHDATTPMDTHTDTSHEVPQLSTAATSVPESSLCVDAGSKDAPSSVAGDLPACIVAGTRHADTFSHYALTYGGIV